MIFIVSFIGTPADTAPNSFAPTTHLSITFFVIRGRAPS